VRRFVEHFSPSILMCEPAVEERINDFAERNNLTIVTIAPMNGNGIYVLFEESEGADDGNGR
jgi:hypothetical protein